MSIVFFPLHEFSLPLQPACAVASARICVASAETSCRHSISAEEKQTGANLRQALREHSFENVEDLARRVIIAHPRENGASERLVRAQPGRRALAATKQSVAQWRSEVRKLSAKLEEFTGDIAAKE